MGFNLKPSFRCSKAFIGETVGFATGESIFKWNANKISSGAKLQLENMTFLGPTRVVTGTLGLNGIIQFTELFPATTDGFQSIAVEGVDFGALQLNDGDIKFNLPGDETLRVQSAEFPWFGGALGVYDATMSLSGKQSVAPLRANNIDLAKILEFADIKGLSGEGVLSGVLPLIVEDGRARIENGVLKSETPGALRYVGGAGEAAAGAGDQAKVAFRTLAQSSL